ncbi:unnamed protein product [Orchesella dallaii]|uniref:Uncharacterized protein n=1 Tax=Orchesella dallaii TaxID=48710 RepID=A0ABP1RSJ6_9HEXA
MSGLVIKVFNLEPAFDVNNVVGTVADEAIDAKQTYINNGAATLTEIYEIRRELTETAEVEFSESFRLLNSAASTVTGSFANSSESKREFLFNFNVGAQKPIPIKVSPSDNGNAEPSKSDNSDVKIGNNNTDSRGNLSASLNFDVFYKIGDAIKSGTEKLLNNKSTEETNISNSTNIIVETKRSFQVRKKITLPECSLYDVTSFVKVTNDVELTYKIQFEITGTHKNGQLMTSELIRLGLQRHKLNRLTFLTEHPRSSNYTMVAESTIKLKLNFGLHSVVKANGTVIRDCMKRHELCQ